MTGTIIRTANVDVGLGQIRQAVDGFIGGYDQIPPMYSALKVNGRKLYELARQGKEIERKPRRVEIHDIQILNYNPFLNEVKLRVDCGKGTYIRTLLYDIGEVLTCGGAMKSLVRTKVGDFLLADSLRLDKVEEYVQNDSINKHIILVEDMFLFYPKLVVESAYHKLIYNGNKICEEHIDKRLSQFNDIENTDFVRVYDSEGTDFVRVYDSEGTFIAIYRYLPEEKRFIAEKMFL
jgi:tRNA pseudouridine55 synthase